MIKIDEIKKQIFISIDNNDIEHLSALLSFKKTNAIENTKMLIKYISNSKYDYKNKKIVDLFFAHGIDIQYKDSSDKQLLHTAVRNQSEYVIKKLLENGANPNSQDKNGYTALSMALYYKYTKGVDILLDYPLENYINKNGQDLFMLAVKYCPYAWKEFINKGIKSINLNNDNKNYFNTIDYAIYNNKKLSIALIENETTENLNELLLKRNSVSTLLHNAMHLKYFNIVNLLIDKGVNLNIRDSYNQTAMDILLTKTIKGTKKDILLLEKLLSNGSVFQNIKNRNNKDMVDCILDDKLKKMVLEYEKNILLKETAEFFDVKQKRKIKRI